MVSYVGKPLIFVSVIAVYVWTKDVCCRSISQLDDAHDHLKTIRHLVWPESLLSVVAEVLECAALLPLDGQRLSSDDYLEDNWRDYQNWPIICQVGSKTLLMAVSWPEIMCTVSWLRLLTEHMWQSIWSQVNSFPGVRIMIKQALVLGLWLVRFTLGPSWL